MTSPDQAKTPTEAITARVQQWFKEQNFAQAEALLGETIRQQPNQSILHYWLGVARARQGKQELAVADFTRAVELDPSNCDGYNGWALALLELGQIESAVAVCEKALKEVVASAKLYSTCAKVFQFANRLPESRRVLAQAVVRLPNEPQLWTNLAVVAVASGDQSTAIDAYQRALVLAPQWLHLHEQLAELQCYQSANDPHIGIMKNALVQAQGTPVEASVAFALAKAFEQLKDYATASEYYRRANRIKAQIKPYQAQADQLLFDRLRARFTPAFLHSAPRLDRAQPAPLFIVGMPRSGTTLVEQILAGHDQVAAAGELEYLPRALVGHRRTSSHNLSIAVAGITAESLVPMAKEYLANLHRHRTPGCRYVTDKMPFNFRWLGLIVCLFPNAKIIHCQRQPQDVIVSNFKTHYSANLGFSTDINHCIEYYQAYASLMDYWRGVLPGQMLEINYEKLVQEPEINVRALLEYCELPFQETCLAPHKNQRSVITASCAQVQQKMYTKAVGYWQNFSPFMPELAEIF